MEYIEELGEKAAAAKPIIGSAMTSAKNLALGRIAAALIENKEKILEANRLDVENGRKNNMSESLIDRLSLSEARIEAMSEGVRQVMALADPIGEIIGGGELQNGLRVVKTRVAMGVIGIIFESRPNVTVDAAALCLKAGSAVILRGGSDALNSNKALTGLMRESIQSAGLPADCVQLVEDVSHETAEKLMRLNRYVDLLIPRGGARLIHTVIEKATIPVVRTGEGNCHVFVDESADLDMALDIVNNAKTQRPSVCNAIENILVHENIAAAFFRRLDMMWAGQVEIYGDEATSKLIKVERLADEKDYATEFIDLKIASKVVGSVDEAIEHINRFGTGHSECIVTNSLENAEKFQREIDAAAVYVNASTRFTDGFEFGLGAEIGISTQKLHARGPMGLKELTSYKYLINGNGQIRR